jgi:hypothetical protein
MSNNSPIRVIGNIVVPGTRVGGLLNPSYVGGLKNWYGPSWSYNVATGLWSNNPTVANGGLGPELLTNGDFTNWTADNPTNWSIVGSEDGTNYVTQLPAGSAKFVRDATGVFWGISQASVLTANNWYQCSVNVTDVTLGSLLTYLGNLNLGPSISAVGTLVGSNIADSTTFYIYKIGSSVANITIDQINVKKIIYSSLFLTRCFDINASISASMTMDNVIGKGGVFARMDNPTNPKYLVHAWRGRSEAVMHLDKIVNGVRSPLISTASAYIAGAVIGIQFPTSTTARVMYNGAQVGGDHDVTNVGYGIYGGLFGTDSRVRLSLQ